MMRKKTHNNVLQKGFTLIEIMVSLSVFIIIMTISLGSILSILGANEKSHTKKTAMDNLNFALESMARTVRFGTGFYCGTTAVVAPDPAPTNDCLVGGSSSFSVRASDNTLVVYSLSGGKIMKSVNNGVASAITSPEMTISRLTFYVANSSAFGVDYAQPRVLMVLSGTVGSKTSTQSTFNLQTMMSQRKLDI